MKTNNTRIAPVSTVDLTTVSGGWGHHHHGGWGYSASVGYAAAPVAAAPVAAAPVAYAQPAYYAAAAPSLRVHVGFRR
jgi:hypothetical protein